MLKYLFLAPGIVSPLSLGYFILEHIFPNSPGSPPREKVALVLGAGGWLGPTVWLPCVSTSTWITFFHLVTEKENNGQCFFLTHRASPPLPSSLDQCWSRAKLLGE